MFYSTGTGVIQVESIFCGLVRYVFPSHWQAWVHRWPLLTCGTGEKCFRGCVPSDCSEKLSHQRCFSTVLIKQLTLHCHECLPHVAFCASVSALDFTTSGCPQTYAITMFWKRKQVKASETLARGLWSIHSNLPLTSALLRPSQASSE